MASPVSTASPIPRWVVVTATALILVDFAKHALLFFAGLDQPWPDSAGYWQLGSVVANGDLWMQRPALGYRTPGYPWFLGGMIKLLGPAYGFGGAIMAQHAAAIVTDLLVTWWTWRLSGSCRAALLAGTWMVLSTARPLYANWILTESLATLLLTLAGYLIWSNRPLQSRRLVAAAVAAGMGILLRPSLVVLGPVLGLAAIVDGWKRPWSFRRRILDAAIPLVVLSAILSPWCERNRQLFSRWTLLTFTGRELWTANFSPWPGAGLEIPADGPAEELRRRVGLAKKSVDLRHNTGVAGALVRSGLSDAESDQLMERVAWKAIRLAPGRSLVHTAARMGTFWYCKEYPPPVAGSTEVGVFSRLPQPRFPAVARVSAAILAWAPERTFLFTWIVSALTWLGVVACLAAPSAVCSPLLSASETFPVGGTRRAGWIIGLLLGGTTILTALLEIPLYRYRLPLEPLGVVATVAGGAAVFLRLRGKTAFSGSDFGGANQPRQGLPASLDSPD